MVAQPETIDQIPTPALIVERSIFDRNVATMAQALPGPRLRPHVKAFKSTALARELCDAGHHNFCAATVREIEGLARAGVGDDLLLANEVLDYQRLGRLVDQGVNITVAIDSAEVLAAAVGGGIRQVLIDVNVGLPRCGCPVDEADNLAELARAAGLDVRGVMGYEGHLMMVTDPAQKAAQVERSMEKLLTAHERVGGDIISAGGTGTYAVNTWATEIQAGSYCLLDTDYAKLDLPFDIALSVLGTVISVSQQGWAVADAGLKAFGFDHGPPTWLDGELMFCSDEHATLDTSQTRLRVGDRVRFHTAHVDPTVAKHRVMWVVDGEQIIDQWPVDLRHW